MPSRNTRGVGVKAPGRPEILSIALYMGCAAAITQVLIIRELLTICRGNEFIIGMIFSFWFTGIYAGARLGAGPKGDLVKRVALSIAALPALLALSVYGAHLFAALAPRTTGSFYTLSVEILMSALFTIPVSFFVGFFFPSLVALLSEKEQERSGGIIFYMESFGSFAGGIVFSFLLVDRANPLAIASFLVIAAVILLSVIAGRKVLFFALIPLVLLIFSARIEKDMFAAFWERTHGGQLVRYQRTRHQTVAMEEAGGTVNIYGDGMLLYSLPDGYDARGLFHLVEALRQGRRKVLLMGSGPGALLSNLLKSDIGELTYCEPDPELWDFLRPLAPVRGGVPGGPVFRVIRGDLKRYLKNTGERFDLIISIPPPPENLMLNRFYTREFYSLCRARLSERGMLIASLHGFSNYLSGDLKRFIASIYRGFTDAFPHHLKTSGETIYLIGAVSGGLLPADSRGLIESYRTRLPLAAGRYDRELTDNYSPEELRSFFEETQIGYFDGAMAGLPGGLPVNSDLLPGAYWRKIILTAFQEQSPLYGLLRGMFLLPALVILASVIALRDIRRLGPGLLLRGLLIYATGLVSISTMLVMMLVYQNTEGIVYYRIALINALFMAGLALGGFVFNRAGVRVTAPVFAGLIAALGGVLACASLPAPFLFWPVLVAFAFLCGAVFPLLFRAGHDRDRLAPASALDSMDHFGAIAGSLLTAVLFLPLLGVPGTVIACMALMAPACVLAFLKIRG